MPTPRGAGIGVWLGSMSSVLIGSSLLHGHRDTLFFGVAVTLFAAIGLIEDLKGMSVVGRLLCQVMLASATAVAIHDTRLSDYHGLSAIGVAIGIGAAGLFYVNAANFMDGVNGLSGLQGIVVGSYFVIVGFSSSSPALTLWGLATAIAFAAFLPWNFPRPTIFLGDVGSYLLGSSIWLLAAEGFVRGIGLVVAISPLVIYSLDVTAALVRRALARSDLLAPHRGHTYQQIQQLTGSHVTAALTCTVATAICLVTGLLIRRGLPDLVGVLVLVIVGAIYLQFPSLLRKYSGKWGAA